MKLFSEDLMNELCNELQIIHAESDEPMEYAEKAIKASIRILEKLKTKFINHKFSNRLDEIDFFRNSKPRLAAKLIYYNEIYTIATNKPLNTKKALRKYYKNELAKLESYFTENKEFYKYYQTGNNALDSKYFLRGKHDFRYSLDSFYFQADQRFCTSHDYKVAKILANEAIRIYIENEISKLNGKLQDVIPKSTNWTGSKVGLIELIYALHAEGVINNGNADLKEVVNIFESVFNIELGQFNRVFLEIRARKFERTKFLNTLKDKLILRMDDADEI